MRLGSLILSLTLAAVPPLAARAQPGGTVERIQVPAAALEGSLQGNATERDVAIYLPPMQGREVDRLAKRLEGWLMPFFSAHLSFQ